MLQDESVTLRYDAFPFTKPLYEYNPLIPMFRLPVVTKFQIHAELGVPDGGDPEDDVGCDGDKVTPVGTGVGRSVGPLATGAGVIVDAGLAALPEESRQFTWKSAVVGDGVAA